MGTGSQIPARTREASREAFESLSQITPTPNDVSNIESDADIAQSAYKEEGSGRDTVGQYNIKGRQSMIKSNTTLLKVKNRNREKLNDT